MIFVTAAYRSAVMRDQFEVALQDTPEGQAGATIIQEWAQGFTAQWRQFSSVWAGAHMDRRMSATEGNIPESIRLRELAMVSFV